MKTSPNIQNEQKVDISLRSVYGITSTGGGLAALRNFRSSMNFPPPVYPKSFNKYINHIPKVADEHCQDSMNMAAESLRKGDDDILSALMDLAKTLWA